jgi:hypothetical protein
MMVNAVFQIITSLTALFNDQLFVAGVDRLWVVDITTWGWVHLLLGTILFFAGGAVMAGKMWGRVVGIILATLGMMVNFAFIPVYPLWSILMVVVSGLVIYALVAHGDEAADLE